MNKPDLRNRPDGATHVSKESHKLGYCWYKFVNGGYYYMYDSENSWSEGVHLNPQHEYEPVWIPGEDLPPVGEEVELRRDINTKNLTDWKAGDVVEVLAHKSIDTRSPGVPVAVVWNKNVMRNTNVAHLIANCFQPIAPPVPPLPLSDALEALIQSIHKVPAKSMVMPEVIEHLENAEKSLKHHKDGNKS